MIRAYCFPSFKIAKKLASGKLSLKCRLLKKKK